MTTFVLVLLVVCAVVVLCTPIGRKALAYQMRVDHALRQEDVEQVARAIAASELDVDAEAIVAVVEGRHPAAMPPYSSWGMNPFSSPYLRRVERVKLTVAQNVAKDVDETGLAALELRLPHLLQQRRAHMWLAKS